jgi:spore maturation protein CgeB
MKVVLFVHSLQSDWNHGNAHFFRGVVSELRARQHDVHVLEPRNGWSIANLVRDHGPEPLQRFRAQFPHLQSSTYDLASLDLGAELEGADLVLVHEWNDPELVRRVGLRRRGASFRLLFHDTHHRAVTAPHEMRGYELADYDGVLAFGGVLRQLYLDRGWAPRAWTWHEAADTRVFRPLEPEGPREDLVWIGNWGDGERTQELATFVLEPARTLGLTGTVHGVRYPPWARATVAASGLVYRGWLPNVEVPRVFARHRATVHVPRRPYVRALPGIPTIRPFEALACGIPLVSAPWRDAEGLFAAGADYLLARNGEEMTRQLHAVLHDEELASSLREHGLRTIQARHTCAHRVEELLAIVAELQSSGRQAA